MRQGADAVIGEQFKQNGVSNSAIHNDDAFDALVKGMEARSTTSGIMPAEMVPSAISLRASATDKSVNQACSIVVEHAFGTSVSSSRRLALSAPAMAPAKVSALTLKVPPLAEVATGASTGIRLADSPAQE